MKKPLIYTAYLSCILFSILFIAKYHNELIHLDFNRLGGLFGDENDIAVFNSIGFCLSLHIFLFNRNIFMKIASFLLVILFSLLSFSSGSKIIIFIIATSSIYCIFALNKREKWYLSIIELVAAFGVFLLFINLPFAAEMKKRFLSMLNVFTPNQIKGATLKDYSTIYRLDMFVDGILMFLRKPIFGWGSDGFAVFGGINGGWSHNQLSEILCNTGLIGFVFYHFPMVLSIYDYLKYKKTNNSVGFLLLILFMTAGISIVLTSEKMFAFIIGVIYSLLFDGKDCFAIDFKKFLQRLRKRGFKNENRCND